MDDSNHFKDQVFTREVRAGRKRRYFIDVKKTKNSDFYITITESKRLPEQEKSIRHKIFLYKEDFNKFEQALKEAIDHIKTELLPEFDFSMYDQPTDPSEQQEGNENSQSISDAGENNLDDSFRDGQER